MQMTKVPVAAFAAAAVFAVAGSVQAQNFSESFDDITTLPAADWFAQNNSAPIGLTNWFQGNTAVFGPQATAGYLGTNFNNTAGTGTISNWMAMPQRSLQNGQTLAFWTRTAAGTMWGDRLQVRMSLAGASTNVGVSATDVGDFTNLLLDINPTYIVTGPGSYPVDWAQSIVVISGVPAATSGRLAFRYFVENGGPTGANSNYIGIDEVVYTAGGPAPCYANCDSSTTPPILNVNDFICFQGKFAAGDPTANCDESTTPPVLNVNDFICFQGKFAAGCP
jgi:hypothetical protein